MGAACCTARPKTPSHHYLDIHVNREPQQVLVTNTEYPIEFVAFSQQRLIDEEEVWTFKDRRIATGHPRGVRVWQLNKELDSLASVTPLYHETFGGKTEIRALAFMDPFESRFLLGACTTDEGGSQKAHSIRVWDLNFSFRCCGELKGHLAHINCLAVSENRIFSGSEDGVIKAWDRHSNFQCVKTVTAHEGPVRGLDFSDGYLFSVGEDLKIKIWDSKSLELRQMFSADTPQPHVKITALYTIRRPSARWMVASVQSPYRLQPGYLAGHLFVSGVDSNGIGCVLVWDLRKGECVKVLSGHTGRIRAMAFGPYDNGPLATGGWDKKIRVWDLTTMTCTHSVEGHVGEVSCLCVEPHFHLFSGGSDSLLKAWRLLRVDEEITDMRSRT
eukprot:GILJ01006311.1.p1 GENE.GILJ01006311.1~~GILJ01006311.1.p1  ORF type:complete len:387 (-),score=26.19 GILJ01006311.1:317-1477(-)